MTGSIEMKRRATGSRAMMLLGAACVMNGLVSCEDVPEFASMRPPALATYVLPAGPQLAPVAAPPSVMMHHGNPLEHGNPLDGDVAAAQNPAQTPEDKPQPPRSPEAKMPIPAAPGAPVAAPPAMDLAPFRTMPQAYPGQPFMARVPQVVPQAVEPSEAGVFMGPLQLLFLSFAAGGAVGAIITKKLIANTDFPGQKAFIGASSGPVRRAGVPTMGVIETEDEPWHSTCRPEATLTKRQFDKSFHDELPFVAPEEELEATLRDKKMAKDKKTVNSALDKALKAGARKGSAAVDVAEKMIKAYEKGGDDVDGAVDKLRPKPPKVAAQGAGFDKMERKIAITHDNSV